MLMDSNDNSDSNGVQDNEPPLNNLLTLPIELLVYITSFLTSARDVVKLRCVSRRLRSVSETPSLWRKFTWPQFDVREERCVKSVLKVCGQFIKRFSFPDHVTHCKITAMLHYCSNLVELSLPTIKLSPDQLKMAMQPMGKLQSLDIPWTSEIHPLLAICNRLKELTITKLGNDDDTISCEMILTEWAKKGFVPETLKVLTDKYMSGVPGDVPTQSLIQLWLQLNPSSPADHNGYFKVYRSFRLPMNLLVLPYFQLQFGQLCALPLVQASKYGLLGLEEDILLLTNCIHSNKVLSKAAVVLRSQRNDIIQSDYYINDIANLAFLTHFNATDCHQLHSGHLEQLTIACPNLLELNLENNINCLKSLHGLGAVAAGCKKLQGLNVLYIPVKNVENQVQLWKILVEAKLTYLGIDWCTLFPHEVDEQVKETIVSLHQKCSDLIALEVLYVEDGCDQCELICEDGDFLLLSNFISLVHLYVDAYQHPTAVKDIFSGCKMLKYFINASAGFDLSCSLVMNCYLEQLSIQCYMVDIPDTFMESVSAHGRLVHVCLYVRSITGDGITVLVENSPNLFTCHVSVDYFYTSPGVHLELEDFTVILKKKFLCRKLFTCGSYHLANKLDHYSTGDKTELTSLWFEWTDNRQLF